MPVFECDPQIELNGDSTYAFLSSITSGEFAHIVVKHGLDNIDRSQWYPLQNVLDVLRDIKVSGNAMTNLVSIGMAAVDNAALPPEVVAMAPDAFFKLYEQLYGKRHRNGQPGTVTSHNVGDKHIQVIMDDGVPYPDDTMYGVFFAYLRRINTQGKFTISYADNQPRKDNGAQQTVFDVKWGQ